ncbi:hypothetical protein C7M84_010044 [Penaeus vannamei]|uniref:C-type lectin domain-containing protein n=1 Tax=Penaeus vannamei TaxID=6689 RepID=A0A3R7SR94_PENVA|nr:hypothetical protein C7M84_010044 [Penaeus vannamei]
MTSFITSLLFTACSLVLAPNAVVSQLQRNCPDNYVLLADKCYGFRRTVADWNNAHPGVYWIGGATRNQGAWTWVATGTPVNEQWWGGAHAPTSQRCAYFCSHTRKYWSSTCDVTKNFICEKSETEVEPEQEIETEEDFDPENEDADAERIPSLPSVRAELRSGASSATHSMAFVVFLLSLCAALV